MKTVLIVEDEEYIALVLKTIITRNFACEVHISRNVSEARKTLEHLSPDVLFVDMNLGDGTGYEVLEIARLKNNPELRTIMMSAYGNDLKSDQPLTSSDFFMEKPFTKEQVINQLKEFDFV